ncbi:MAG: hypothetical protein HYX92_02780, partial [Chloroflexi bacterium]|nr:hypothetical protein [Chloroflexota bacterium]
MKRRSVFRLANVFVVVGLLFSYLPSSGLAQQSLRWVPESAQSAVSPSLVSSVAETPQSPIAEPLDSPTIEMPQRAVAEPQPPPIRSNDPGGVGVGSEAALVSPASPGQSGIIQSADGGRVEVGPEGGTVMLPGNGELIIPAGAVASRTRISRSVVEMRISGGLQRYRPLDQPIEIGARRSDDNAPITRLERPAIVRLKLDRPEVATPPKRKPAVRVLKPSGWELAPASYEPVTKVFSLDVQDLPVTLALVDDSRPPASGGWDPNDPAAVQLDDGSWAIAAVDASTPLKILFRRSLENSEFVYWMDWSTAEPNGDSPALVKLGSTLALFFRQTVSNVKQVKMRTSTDDGKTWSSATQLTTETVDVYQIQASNAGGTVNVFWSLKNDSGLLRYRTSTDLSNWSAPANVGQTVGRDEVSVKPVFDIRKFSSGAWGLTWLEVSTICPGCVPGSHDYNSMNNALYPVVWYASSTDLSSTAWSNKQELTLPYTDGGEKQVSVAQNSIGTVYLAYNLGAFPSSDYLYFRTSGDDGATWSSKTLFGYEVERPVEGSSAVNALNPYLVPDSSGNLRAFWDQFAARVSSYVDGYPAHPFWADLPSGGPTPPVSVPIAVDPMSKAGPQVKHAAFTADRVNAATGLPAPSETDLSIPGRGPGLVFQRTYNPARLVDGPLGYGWTHSYNGRLYTYSHGEALIIGPTGRADVYVPNGAGGYTPPIGDFSTLVHNGDGAWTLTGKNQTRWAYSSAGKLTSIADRNSNTATLTYDGNGVLTSVTDPSGRSLTFGYASGRISSIVDPLGRTISFSYSPSGDLASVVDMRGKTWTYTYANHLLTIKQDPYGNVVYQNAFASLTRVKSQEDAFQKVTSFEYDSAGTFTYANDPLGYETSYAKDTQYRVTQVTDPSLKVVYRYYQDGVNLTMVNDARNSGTWNRTWFTYDTRGNVLTRKNELNNTWTYTYNSFNDVLTQRDPLNHTTTYVYNASGNLTSATNARNETTTYTPNSYGQVTATTDARGKTTSFGYDAYGNRTTVTDPYNKTWTTAYDLAGRKTAATDPLGHVTSFAYDNNNNLTSTT